MASSKVSLKLLIDAKSKNVLFAEAGKDFVDFLFYLMAMPVGTVINLLKKNGMVGCLSNLYESIENLSDTYMLKSESKDSLLNPRSSGAPVEFPLLLTGGNSKFPKFYRSDSAYCGCLTDVSGTYCQCGQGETPFIVGNTARKVSSAAAEVGFVKGVVTYMVMDDLSVQPLSSISSISLLNKLNVKEVGSLQEKVVSFGMTEAVKLLKASFRSKTVLTDVFLNNA